MVGASEQRIKKLRLDIGYWSKHSNHDAILPLKWRITKTGGIKMPQWSIGCGFRFIHRTGSEASTFKNLNCEKVAKQ
jgi:hypothetical protein